MEKDKVICTERRCGWQGTTEQMLKAPNPFEPDDEIIGCPDCKGVDTLVVACDVDGCWKETTCGFPTPEGYRRTCGNHYREYKASDVDCGNCHMCLKDTMVNGIPATSSRMVLCVDCGNKRCPKASDHRLTCTGSNEPNQKGSIY